MRLDNALVATGLVPSRARARDAVLRGHVTIDGVPAEKPAASVSSQMRLEVSDPVLAYVSRAALKLIAALDHFGYTTSGISALDIGASTGGFTEVLLKRGADRVHCLDVGHGQLHPLLARDPRVINLEGLNARNLQAESIREPFSAITADVSFISLKLALAPALALASEGAWGVLLVKPQFEVGRDHIGKGGIVRDPVVRRNAVDGIADWIEADMHWSVDGIIDSPIEGGNGNREYLLGARRG